MSDFSFLDSRCEEAAAYIIQNHATVRLAAAALGISKSTVHKDVTERLYLVNISLYEQVKAILEQNKAERHLRGGEATKHKYEAKKMQKLKRNDSDG